MARPANPGLRDEILKAAASTIEDCGPDCVTMRQVADQIGYSPTTIYNHFADKEDVLRAAVRLAIADLKDVCEVAAVGPRAIDRVRQSSRAYVVWGITHPGHYRLMFEYSEEIRFSEDDLALVSEALAWQREDLNAAMSAGELTVGRDPNQLASALWAGLHGATSLASSGRLVWEQPKGGPATVATATAAADLLTNGLLEDAHV